MVTSLNCLPPEIRQNIFLSALYRTYEPNEFRSALRDPNPAYSVFVEADIKLGQKTLSASKLTDWSTHHEAAAASEIWVKYLTLDLLEELETIRERQLQLATQFTKPYEFNRACANSWSDSQRYTWISQMELSRVHWHRWRLRHATNEVWRRRRTYEDGVSEFLDMCERKDSMERTKLEPLQGPLEKQLVVCFGPADAVVTQSLAKGLPAGTRGLYGDHT
ncbi:MAG: hypothetical protein L6R38_001972 [Xanthoria sp. 2 TBL-2021]|nr:MAG: hypothetical protein L6R38_001972 [Xanthoria sp. 2 TBL-2021]